MSSSHPFETMSSSHEILGARQEAPGARSVPDGRQWVVFGWYTTCALAGALVGRGLYLPTPPLLGSIVISDLRYPGAIAGALFGAISAALLVRFCSRIPTFRVLKAADFVIAGLLAYFLCELNILPGAITLGAVFLPVFVAILPRLGRSNRSIQKK